MAEGWLEYEITAEDVRAYARLMQRVRERRMVRTRASRLAGYLLAALGSLLLVVMGIATVVGGSFEWMSYVAADRTLRALLAALVVVILLYLLIRLSLPHITLWAARQSRLVLGPCKLRLTDAGLEVATAHVQSEIGWKGIQGLEESPEALYVMLGPHHALIVPTRAFEGPAARQLFGEELRRRAARRD